VQLATDLALWSHGLFSLFPHANEVISDAIVCAI